MQRLDQRALNCDHMSVPSLDLISSVLTPYRRALETIEAMLPWLASGSSQIHIARPDSGLPLEAAWPERAT